MWELAKHVCFGVSTCSAWHELQSQLMQRRRDWGPRCAIHPRNLTLPAHPHWGECRRKKANDKPKWSAASAGVRTLGGQLAGECPAAVPQCAGEY